MLTIRLLGQPALERDGRLLAAPRGRKAWVLLALVLLADRPLSRRELASLLFDEAADPLGALRWSLAELRRALGEPTVLAGNPVRADLPDDVEVDVLALLRQPSAAVLLGSAGGELLAGVDVVGGPGLASWLMVERYRLAGAVQAQLRRASRAALAEGRAGEAVRLASRSAVLDPLDEGAHELLARALVAAGDVAAAHRQVALCRDVLARELGTVPSAALLRAADPAAAPRAAGPADRAVAAGQLEAGRAAVSAGAVDAGLGWLYQAVATATASGDDALQARALAAVGAALVHSVRGRDEEGAVFLHRAAHLALSAGDRATAATVHRELGFVEVQAGRPTAERWLALALDLADADGERSAVLGVRGMGASDRGDYPAALTHLRASVECARRADDPRQEAWSASILARAHLVRGEHSQAELALTRSLELVHQQRWVAFLPWPTVLLAEVDLAAGRLDRAEEALHVAWTLARQLDDPCWEGMAARGLGRLDAGRGRHPGAQRWFDEAVRRARRVPDRYQWVHAHVLDGAAGCALDRGDTDRATPLVDALAGLAARCGFRELVVRAQLHRHRLGEPGALEAARQLGATIDNPALADVVRAAGG